MSDYELLGFLAHHNMNPDSADDCDEARKRLGRFEGPSDKDWAKTKSVNNNKDND